MFLPIFLIFEKNTKDQRQNFPDKNAPTVKVDTTPWVFFLLPRIDTQGGIERGCAPHCLRCLAGILLNARLVPRESHGSRKRWQKCFPSKETAKVSNIDN